jgi:hypothetical protein
MFRPNRTARLARGHVSVGSNLYNVPDAARSSDPISYIREDFLARSFRNLDDLNAQLQHWLYTVANPGVHATIQRVVNDAFAEEKPHLKTLLLLPFRSALKLTSPMKPRSRMHQQPPPGQPDSGRQPLSICAKDSLRHRHVPAGLVDQKDGVGGRFSGCDDLREMQVHRFGIAGWQETHEVTARSACRPSSPYGSEPKLHFSIERKAFQMNTASTLRLISSIPR